MILNLDIQPPLADLTYQRPSIQITVTRWDWSIGARKDPEDIDITDSVLSYQYQKTIKTPMSGLVITAFPEYDTWFYLNDLSPMDVIKVREFGKIKFIGYIRTVGATGAILDNGKPQRTATITATHMGGLLQEANLGLVVCMIRATQDPNIRFSGIGGAAQALAKRIADTKASGSRFKDIVTTVIDEWKRFLIQMGADKFVTYMNTFFDFSTGLAEGPRDLVPREGSFFYSQSETMSIYTELQKLVEAPMMELWFDDGNRNVCIDGEMKDLTQEKTYLIMRETPFDGAVENGASFNRFTNVMWAQRILPLSRMRQWSLSKSMEEAFSYYFAMPTYNNLSSWQLMARGVGLIDDEAMNKYLFSPLQISLFYESLGVAGGSGTAQHPRAGNLTRRAQDAVESIRNWYKLNDVYLSGSITRLVAADYDMWIGDKLKVDGIHGNFYIEGDAHQWSYGGPLTSSLTVTRGYGPGVPMDLQRDRIFRQAVEVGSRD